MGKINKNKLYEKNTNNNNNNVLAFNIGGAKRRYPVKPCDGRRDGDVRRKLENAYADDGME
jgi:hypothetical protein